VIASSVNVIHAVWLDPFCPIDTTDRAQLNAAGISVETVSTLGDLAVALRRAHLLIIRLNQSAELLSEVQTLVAQLGCSVPILCRVDRRHMEVAVDAMKFGALHVIAMDEWTPSVWAQAVKGLNSPEIKTKHFVFVDPISQHLLALAQRVAQTNVAALLVGPTGSGKEVLARVLHESSPRVKGPFVALNCAAMPEHLIEDMLFGHEKGAFTGALKEHKGLFEQARGGTIFLDEIGEMPMNLQAKLLRVLQEKKLNRLGGETTIDLDVRVIAATNKDLKLAIEQREFREDLYFRISTFRLRIQPLKERLGDIAPLVAQSLARHTKDGVSYNVTPEALAMLESYPWPGNVRELENIMQRAVVMCDGRTITPAQLLFDDAFMDVQSVFKEEKVSAELTKSLVDTAVSQNNSFVQVSPINAVSGSVNSVPTDLAVIGKEVNTPINLEHAVKVSEHQMIMAAIQTTDSRMAAAEKLGISPRTLRYKIAQLRSRGMIEGASA
jgi:two-component system, response regulator FlrC